MYYLSSNKNDFDENLKRISGWIRDENEFLEYIIEMKGAPLNAMRFLASSLMANTTQKALEHNAAGFRFYASVAAKMLVMSAKQKEINGAHHPYWLSGEAISEELFYPIMSDDEKIIGWHINNIDQISSDAAIRTLSDVEQFMQYTILLAIEGKQWELVKSRVKKILDKNFREYKKRIPDYEFLIALANKDLEGMKTVIHKFLMPRRNAKMAARETLPFLDFYLQPQALFYAKLAARHGFDLEIDDEIAPKSLIEYKPLKSYEEPYEFMKEYDWNAPYEFQEEWIKRFTIIKDQ